MNDFQVITMFSVWFRILCYSLALTTAALWIDLPTLVAAFLIIFIVRMTFHSLPAEEID